MDLARSKIDLRRAISGSDKWMSILRELSSSNSVPLMTGGDRREASVAMDSNASTSFSTKDGSGKAACNIADDG